MSISVLRRHRYWVIAAVALAAVIAFGVFEIVSAPRIEAVRPGADAFLGRSSATIEVDLSGADHLHGLSARIDDRDVSGDVRIDGDRLSFPTGQLADGVHVVTFKASTSNVLRPSVSKTWRFTVDTTAPTLTITRPRAGAVVTTDPVAVSGRTEPGVRVTVRCGDHNATNKADDEGRFSLSLRLDDGSTKLSVEARDGAGNGATKASQFVVDTEPPDLLVTGVSAVVKESMPRVVVTATDAAGDPNVKVVLDGETIFEQPVSSQARIPVDKLVEGRHSFVVTAVDRGRNLTADDQPFLVNSTETLGKAVLAAGAKGRDVRDLQKLLANQGYYKGPKTGVYDRHTVLAVQRLERRLGMDPDGVTGEMVLGALRGRIVVDQSELKLYFYLNGKLKFVFPVATGQLAYPTPNGTFHVAWMVKNPTWIPPDSPWALGEEPIPPGPGNPLGTRWIATSAPGVGMHGTEDVASIGTHASHGCIRMRMGDVERLYEWVTVGMPVIIKP